MLSFFLAAFVHLAILSGGMGIRIRGTRQRRRPPATMATCTPWMLSWRHRAPNVVFSSYWLAAPKGGVLERQTPTIMQSRVEIARAWDLFHLGAFPKPRRCFLAHVTDDPEAAHVRLWIAIRRDDYRVEARRLGAWLAQHGRREPCRRWARARKSPLLPRCDLPLEEWLPATSNGLKPKSRMRARSSLSCKAPLTACETELAQALPQTASSAFATPHFARGSTDYTNSLKSKRHICFTRFHLRSTVDVDRGLQATIAGTLAPLVRELELGELGDRAEQLLESVVWPQERTMSRFYTQRALAWRKAFAATGSQRCISWMAPCRSRPMLRGAESFLPIARA